MAIAACVALLAGCDDYDDRYTSEYASVARLEVFGEQELTSWTINDTEDYTVRVLRSGHDINIPSQVIVSAMSDDEWTAHAAMYGMKRYHKIPDDCFTFAENAGTTSVAVDFAPRQMSAEAIVKLFSAKLNEFSNSLPSSGVEGDENILCLPIKIEASTGSVLPTQNNLILKIISKEAVVTLSETGFEKIACLPTTEPIVREYTVSLSCKNNWGFTAKLKNSQELLDSYNTANGTRYTLIQPGALEILDGETWKPWSDMTLNFPEGQSSVIFSVRLDPAKAGAMDALALSVSQPSINVTADNLSNIVALQVKPSNARIKIAAGDITASSDDGKHTAKNLVDGKRNTYYTSGEAVHDGDPVYGSYVDMKLPSPIRYFAFDFMSRFDYFGDGSGIPNEVHIYVSNDGTQWEKCGEITKMRADFNGKSQTVTYGNFDAGKEVDYVRWAVVKGGAAGNLDFREQNTTAFWDATALYIFGK